MRMIHTHMLTIAEIIKSKYVNVFLTTDHAEASLRGIRVDVTFPLVDSLMACKVACGWEVLFLL